LGLFLCLYLYKINFWPHIWPLNSAAPSGQIQIWIQNRNLRKNPYMGPDSSHHISEKWLIMLTLNLKYDPLEMVQMTHLELDLLLDEFKCMQNFLKMWVFGFFIYMYLYRAKIKNPNNLVFTFKNPKNHFTALIREIVTWTDVRPEKQTISILPLHKLASIFYHWKLNLDKLFFKESLYSINTIFIIE